MAAFYAMQIKNGKMRLEDVPELWREKVKNLLN